MLLSESSAVRVLVQPLNRIIEVQPGANLLQALQAAKLPVSYSCMAGRCGTCRCRVVAGDVFDHGPHRARQREDDGNFVLACQTYLTEPCTIEIPEPDEVVVHPPRIARATVMEVNDLAHDIRRVLLEPAKPIRYSPGQYLQVELGAGLSRPYSMANLCTERFLEFHVRVLPNGRVSGHIARVLRPRDTVKLTGPLGTSYLRRKHTGPILCVAASTGLAPILSIIRGALLESMRNPIHLYFAVRSPADLYGLEWLEALATQHHDMTVHVVIASGGNPRRQRLGLVTQAIESDLASLEGWCAYVCGSPPMVEAVSLLVKRLGISPRRVYADAYYPQGN
jgi:naphthalene 1,2-dioxygenase ferredoxin reductase component